VWYLDITRRGGADWLTVPIDQLLDQAVEDATPPRATTPDIERLASAPILRLTPFIEQMGNPSGIRKEFWWEREWRHVGDLSFGTDDIVVVFAPEDEHDLQERLSGRPRFASRMPAIASNMPAFVDAQWGLERMIGAFLGVLIVSWTVAAHPIPRSSTSCSLWVRCTRRTKPGSTAVSAVGDVI
jgi:hypothetical protein